MKITSDMYHEALRATGRKEYPQKSPQSSSHPVVEIFPRAVTDRSNRYLLKQRGEVKMQDKGFSQKSVLIVKGNRGAARKFLKGRNLLKAAVGIEPTNKGFAV